MNHFLKKSNQILQSNYLYYFLVIFSIVFLFFTTKIIKYKSIFSGSEKFIVATVTDYNKKDNYIELKVKSNEKTIVYYYDVHKKFKIGDKVRFYGNFEKPTNNTNFNQFNYKKYLYNKGIYYIFKSNKSDNIGTSNNVFYKIKNIVFNRIEKSKENQYLSTFVIGKNVLNENTKEMYTKLGINHLMAISGMHVSFFVFVFIFLLDKINIRKDIVSIFLIMFLFLYMFITGFSSSILRCGVFFIVSEIFKILKLNISSIKRFIISMFLIIMFNPFIIYDLGYIYSFTISLYLILFKSLIRNKKNYLSKLFLISLISFLVSMPITLYNFYKINVLSVLFNMICVPFVSFIIFPLSIISFIFPFLIFIFRFFINIFELVCRFLSEIDSTITIGKPNIFFIVLYYIFITLVLYKRGIAKIKYIIFLTIIIFFNYNYNYIFKSNFIIFLNVNQGDSILLNLNSHSILVDTGKHLSKNNSLESKINIFNSMGVKNIEYLIISHGDFDHMGEAINLVNNFKVEKVIFNCGEFNDLEQELIKVLDKMKIPYYSCIKELNIDNNKLYFLQTREYDNENDNSNVIYTEINGYKFMFMGDAGIEKEKDILDKYNISDVDVLKVGHHGSKTSSSNYFINEIDPNYSIISVGKNNRYGHPNKEVLNNLDNSKIYRTDEDGSIMFKIKNNKLKIETCSP